MFIETDREWIYIMDVWPSEFNKTTWRNSDWTTVDEAGSQVQMCRMNVQQTDTDNVSCGYNWDSFLI
jgi:hypothetical protein